MCDHTNDPGGREAAMTVIQRDADDKPTVWCDPCLSPVVAALNAAGIKTIASCCGHGKNDSSIALEDGRWIIIANEAPTAYEYRFYQPIAVRLAACECGHPRAFHRLSGSCTQCGECGYFRKELTLEITEEEKAMLDELRDSRQGWRANYGNTDLDQDEYEDTPSPDGTV